MFVKQVLLRHTFSPFCSGYFGDGGLLNYLLRLASKGDPPISASQVATIKSMSHTPPASLNFELAHVRIIVKSCFSKQI
jgi:hypothetical protein